MTKQYKNYVNGEWKLSKEEIKIYAPATGEELGSVPAMSQEEVDYVYASAKAAQKAWRALSYVERAEYLQSSDILMRDAENRCSTFKRNCERLQISCSEVIRTAEIINYAAEEGSS